MTCSTFYADPDNQEEGWAPTESVEFPISLTPISRMILLTGDIVKAAAKGDMTPWELRLERGKTRLTAPPLLEAEDLKLFDR